MCIWKGKNCYFLESSWTSCWTWLSDTTPASSRTQSIAEPPFWFFLFFFRQFQPNRNGRKIILIWLTAFPLLILTITCFRIGSEGVSQVPVYLPQPNTGVKRVKDLVYFCLNNQVHERIISVLPPWLRAQIIFNCKRNFLDVHFKRRMLELY